MNTKKVLLILPIFILILISYLWFRDRNYLAAIQTAQSIASEGLKESDYAELPNLIKNLPGTRAIFTPEYYKALRGNDKVRRIYRASDEINVDLRFTDTEDDAEKRSAKITLDLGETDLSDTILFISVKIRGNIIGQGHQRSRAQLELTDANNKRMMGPKIPIASGETPLILRPTITEPIPTGSFQDNFDIKKVKSLTIRFIIGRPDQMRMPASGKLVFSEIYKITNLDLVSKTFRIPDTTRVTRDALKLEYQLRKLKWKFEENEFFIGVNYPWNNYGWDVGKNPYGLPENSGWSAILNEEKLRKDFIFFKTIHPNFVVRIYIFCDLRTGLNYKDGMLIGFDTYVRRDIETIFRVAGQTGIKLDVVLFDFGIANGQGKPAGEHPELIFSPEKRNFLVNVVRPLLVDMEKWNNYYGEPVFAIELMNEPDNMAMLLIPGHFNSLKIWFKDLINIIHQETSFKVTLGSHSIVDMQRWWTDLEIDIWQFHFYKYMQAEHEQWPQNLKRSDIKTPGLMFCGEFEPYNIKENLDIIKANGYNGVLFWSWNANDGFKMSPEQINEMSDSVANDQKEVR